MSGGGLQTSDWFADNAAKAPPQGDWFSENARGKASIDPLRAASQATSLSAPPPSTGWRDSVARWADDVSSDLKYGSGITAIGRVMKVLGAQGLAQGEPEAVADFMGSPVLGPLRAVKGGAEVTQEGKTWQGTKDIIGGALDTAQIPGSFMGGPAAEEGGSLAAKFLSKSEAATDAWRKINDVLGVSAKAIRIGKDATSLESASTLPGRALANLGFTAEQLEKMTPLERMQAIAPHWRDAGRAIDEAVGAATHAGTTLDLGKSATNVLKSIKNPQLQEQAVAGFNDLVKELDVLNQRGATPEEALRLRRALQAGARFGPNGDLNSLGSIRAQLYSAVSGDLQNAVQGLKQLDQHYSDLKGAIDAAQSRPGSSLRNLPRRRSQSEPLSLGKSRLFRGLPGEHWGMQAIAGRNFWAK